MSSSSGIVHKAKVDYFLSTDALRDFYNSLIRQQRSKIFYSDKYSDDTHEFRHVKLSPDMKDLVPTNRLMSEAEWRQLGVSMSPGWVHYMIHDPEPHVLLFRRSLTAADAQYQQQQMQQHLLAVQQQQ
jgi:cyclin-dependent kinase regulatory subunit CKS1